MLLLIQQIINLQRLHNDHRNNTYARTFAATLAV